MAVSTLDIAWLAGLLEGEGCFFVANHVKNKGGKIYKQIGISLVMTDEEPVNKAAELLNVNVFGRRKLKSGKTIHRLTCTGSKAAAWMMTIYTLLCPRRQAKIEECLSVWKAQKSWGYRKEFAQGGVLSQTI